MFDRFSITKHPTDCCALTQLSICDYHTKEEIQEAIKYQQKEANIRPDWINNPTKLHGQKNIFVITTPNEHNLRKNLQELGFECVSKGKMKRRTGYPPGRLDMWLLCLD